MRQRVVLSLLLVAVAAGTAQAADDARLARQHFEDGSRLYDLGKFRDAAREYEEAYKYKPDPALLFNIGQAYRAAGDVGEALTAYKSYLRRMPEARNRAEVAGHIEKLQRLVDEQRRHPTTATTPPPPAQLAAPPAQLTPPQATPPPDSTVQPALVTATPAAPAERQPLYKKWWLWTAVGGAVVIGGVVAIAVATTTPKDASSPANTFGVSLH
jgi:tetratricopeptide (TPR) repeat protein